MLITTGLWLVATGVVAVSLESFGAALVLFGLAGWLLSYDRRQSQTNALRKMGPLWGLKSGKFLLRDFKKWGALRSLLLR